MFFRSPEKSAARFLFAAGIIIAVAIFLNPSAGVDLLLIGALLLIIGHVYLGEKLLLVFLIIRPALDYWRDFTLFQYKDTAVNVNAALALLFFAWSAALLAKYRKRIRELPLLVGASVFCALIIASIFWSASASAIEGVKFLNQIGFFWLGYLFTRSGKITPRLLAGAIALSGILPVIAGIIQLLLGSGISTFDIHGRIFGTLAHPNVFAFLLLSFIILLTQFGAMEPDAFLKKWNGAGGALFALLVILLLFTYTRAAFIGAGIFALIIGLYKKPRLTLKIIIAISLIAIIIPPLNGVFIKTFNASLADIPIAGRLIARNEDADSISWRQSVFRETLPIIHSRPWLGFGYGAFQKVWSDNRSADHQFDDSAEAHNDYLRVALELGLVGLALYVGILVRLSFIMYHLSRKNPRRYLHLFAWIIVFAIVSFSDNMLHHTPVMWLTFAWWGAMLAEPPKLSASPNLLG